MRCNTFGHYWPDFFRPLSKSFERFLAEGEPHFSYPLLNIYKYIFLMHLDKLHVTFK